MNPLNETLTADPGTEIATGALPQSAVVPIDDEPAPRLIVEPPLPGPLAAFGYGRALSLVKLDHHSETPSSCQLHESLDSRRMLP